MYTGIITDIRNITSHGEFKILKFTVNRYVDEFLSTEVTYEIAPSMRDGGSWIRTNDSIVEEPELKEIINNHMHNWPDDLISEYERQQDLKELKSAANQDILSNEEIDAILRELL